MDLTLLPSKKTIAKFESRMLVIAQGNSVIELTLDQAEQLVRFVDDNLAPSVTTGDQTQDLGM